MPALASFRAQASLASPIQATNLHRDFRATTRQDWRPAYLEAASGSIPLLLIASAARGEARNSINRLEAALSFDSATTAAAKTWIN